MITPNERTDEKKVTLEELLRLKRAERPDPEFWCRFEHDLRAKQLAAIVEPRPWWIALRLPQAARVLVRFQLPMGAAAALALGFIVVREYRPVTIQDSVSSPALSVVAMAPVVEASAVNHGTVDQAPAVVVESAVARVEPASVATAHPVEAVTAVESASGSTGSLTSMIPWAALTGGATSEVPVSGELSELTQVHFASAMTAEHEHDFQGRVEVVPVVARVETVLDKSTPVVVAAATAPVQAVTQREVRRSRILASLAGAEGDSDVETVRVAQTREVASASLDDDRLYDSVRRVGMGGDRLTLKF